MTFNQTNDQVLTNSHESNTDIQTAIQSIKENLQQSSELTLEQQQPSATSDQDSTDLNHFDDLTEKRQLINELLLDNRNTGKEGDEFYLISSEYLTKFLNLPVDNLYELKQQLGPINCTSIVDSLGNLYPENNEPIPTYNISKEIFEHLSSWMGVVGNPVSRNLIINSDTGAKEVERYPVTFLVHQLGSPKRQQHITSHFRSSHRPQAPPPPPPPVPIALSRTKTFNDLIETIRTNIFKTSKKSIISDFRIWFIDEDSLPFHIPISAFVYEIGQKSLVTHSLFGSTIKSQGITKGTYDILIEVKERNHFPLDQFVLSHSNAVTTAAGAASTSTSGGHLGLSNLGNTCYMNSALQCLLHVPEINFYFYYNIYKQELNVNNPLGYHGNVANSFGSLLKQAFDKRGSGSGSISPRDFKSTIGRYSSMFSGYLQQDSQEFLSWLLDALHEDLNRIHEKPYCEKPELNDDEINDSKAIIELSKTCWNQHLARNDSVITDLFTGLYQSTLVCPDCSKTSITFDPFNDLTLPLPISKKWYHTFTIVDLSPAETKTGTRIMKLEVELNKTSNFDDLLNYLGNFLKTPTTNLFIYEIFHNSFYSDFQRDYIKNRFHPIGDIIRDNDEIIVYIIPHDPESDIIVPVFNAVENADKSYKVTNIFGIPLFVVLNKEKEAISFGQVRKKLVEVASVLTTVDLVDEYETIKQSKPGYIAKEYYNKHDFTDVASISDGEESEGYDSDVSLANPYVDGDFGFTMMYIHDYNSHKLTSSSYFRSKFSKSKNENDNSQGLTINVPLHKPNFHEFKSLADQLPENKRNYYHHSKVVNASEEVQEETDKADEEDAVAAESEDSSTTDEEFVMVDPKVNVPPVVPIIPPSVSESVEEQLSAEVAVDDEEEEEEETENEMAVGSLFDSTANLPLAPGSESTIPSNVNSPRSPEDSGEDEQRPLVTKDTILLCDWDNEIFQRCFGEEELTTWNEIPSLSNPELEQNRAHFERQRKAKISLYDCVRSFGTPEVLGEHDLWYCPRCKEHKRATKTIQIWSTGDILTIHLKRFHSARAFSDKIDILIDFPINGLDISSYVSDPIQTDCVYDLIAVDNHYGGLGGGHYTASVKNFRDNNWYYFNDSRVTRIDSAEEVITNAAYLLFYRRRSTNEFLGSEKLNYMLEKGRDQYNQELVNRQASIDVIAEQIKQYGEFESNLIKQIELDKELESRKKRNAQFNLDEEQLDSSEEEEEEEETSEEESDDNDNVRKQRLISKGNNNSKLIQIKSNGRQEVTSSPINLEESDGDLYDGAV
ncbi:uncharacterized protein SPAPADRAFT_52038 [Spathaspora passalidarum NRRL Y-27907]|uniref:ubiquitinyl hydrolase 1 n=1 Tax=Spathaspora passalidarum (strain NRRL Y-27907 / 11-Y1) TaxID=619300 RepID=G3AT76_SPAPN|nr:uncharacterized protein SPAPADRAFT_52038 [Spathaspora passalidarum NRRL Y-27907]EGW30839.1 hypothetical protein SPAPADRAFT_52038 [Spathaspora passalidarum NRRL Y-27907]